MYKKVRIVLLLLIIIVVSVNPDVYNYQSNAATKAISSYSTATTKVYDSKSKLIAAIRAGLLGRKSKIVFSVPNTDEFDDMTGIIKEALAYDDKTTAKDGDYLAYSLTGWRYETNSIVGGDTKDVTILPGYRTTLKEEKVLAKKIASVLKALKLTDASDYEKVKAIHDYIIKRVSYDTTLQKESAYNALIQKSCVCSGYALLAYRMFIEAGLPCRIIEGYGKEEPHAWNIVQVDGEWYNIDLTWDDPISPDGKQVMDYEYFLKNEEDFNNHSRDKKFETKEFLQQYPIAETSYVMEEER